MLNVRCAPATESAVWAGASDAAIVGLESEQPWGTPHVRPTMFTMLRGFSVVRGLQTRLMLHFGTPREASLAHLVLSVPCQR